MNTQHEYEMSKTQQNKTVNHGEMEREQKRRGNTYMITKHQRRIRKSTSSWGNHDGKNKTNNNNKPIKQQDKRQEQRDEKEVRVNINSRSNMLENGENE